MTSTPWSAAHLALQQPRGRPPRCPANSAATSALNERAGHEVLAEQAAAATRRNRFVSQRTDVLIHLRPLAVVE